MPEKYIAVTRQVMVRYRVPLSAYNGMSVPEACEYERCLGAQQAMDNVAMVLEEGAQPALSCIAIEDPAWSPGTVQLSGPFPNNDKGAQPNVDHADT
jgi:hypothetical protein